MCVNKPERHRSAAVYFNLTVKARHFKDYAVFFTFRKMSLQCSIP